MGGFRVIKILMISPVSRNLRVIASEQTHQMPRSIRLLLRSKGSWGTDDRLARYLLFEPGYTGALVGLGCRDALAQGDDISSFIDD